MTHTIATSALPTDLSSGTTRTGTGPTNPVRRGVRHAAAAYLTTATAATPTGQRVRGLLDELREIDADRQMAYRFGEPGTWLAELAAEERDVWDHIVEALTAVSSANTEKE